MAILTGPKRKLRERLFNIPTLLYLFRSAIAPTAALCLLLNDRIAGFLGPVGYIAGILAINPVLPQAQHLELVLQNVLALCLGTALTLLELYCVIRAREASAASKGLASQAPAPSTDGPTTPIPYSSSAAAVAGVWLVTLIFAVCFVRSVRPSLMMPCIIFSVLAVVTSSIAPTLPDMSAAVYFAKQMLVVNVIGLGVFFASGLLAWPDTNRAAFEDGVRELIDCFEQCLAARIALLRSLIDRTALRQSITAPRRDQAGVPDGPPDSVEKCVAVYSSATLLATYNKMRANLPYTSGEVAIGHLTVAELVDVQDLLTEVLKPMLGLVASMDFASKIFGNIAPERHRDILGASESQATRAHQILLDTLRHGLTLLGFRRPMKGTEHLKSASKAASSDLATLKQDLTDLQADEETQRQEWRRLLEQTEGMEDNRTKQMLFYLTTQTQGLSLRASQAAVKFAEFAERKTASGATSRRRLHLPVVPLKAHPRATFGRTASDTSRRIVRSSHRREGRPFDMLTKLALDLRKVTYILRSPHAAFAIRIALAVLCSQLPAYLRHTQVWYNQQRVVWASITIAIVTNRRLGQSVFGVLCQIAGTLAGCLLSLVAWYIVDRKIPGVMVMYFFCMMLAAYPANRRPQLSAFSMVAMVTLTLLVGYELESERAGRDVVTSLGQPYYPPYILSWRNMLAILAGVGIAFFWTVLPYPILESDEVPEQIGDTLYSLAELHTRSYTAVHHRITSERSDNDATTEPHPQQQLSSVESRLIRDLTNLRDTLQTSTYQIEIGSKFPRKAYIAILDRMDSLFRAISLVSYTSRAFNSITATKPISPWMQELRKSFKTHRELEQQFTTVLAACGTCIARRQPLPPFLALPERSSLLDVVKEGSTDLLDLKYANEEGYMTLSMLHASALLAAEDVRELLKLTEEVVGRMDLGVGPV